MYIHTPCCFSQLRQAGAEVQIRHGPLFVECLPDWCVSVRWISSVKSRRPVDRWRERERAVLVSLISPISSGKSFVDCSRWYFVVTTVCESDRGGFW